MYADEISGSKSGSAECSLMLGGCREIGDMASLQESLPYKPYCTDSLKSGLLVRPRRTALQKKYLSLNPPHMKVFLVFDLDYEVLDLDFIRSSGLPLPAWCVVNRANNHAHLIYVLSNPVYTASMAHLEPLRYLQAIKATYCRKLKADPMYSGLVAKNPWCEFWRVIEVCKLAYDLDSLAKPVADDLKSAVIKKPVEEVAGLGRNCCVFENVRLWSYRAIRNFWDKSFASWHEEVLDRCQQENAKFLEPMDEREVRGIAKSISSWTWRHITPDGFSEVQLRRVSKRWKSCKGIGLSLLEDGVLPREVRWITGFSKSTIYRWQAFLEESGKIGTREDRQIAELMKKIGLREV